MNLGLLFALTVTVALAPSAARADEAWQTTHLAGSGAERLRHAVVAPDGSRIAFVGAGGYVAASDGSNVIQVAPAGQQGGFPQFSPDASRLAYEYGGELFVVSVEGGEAVRVSGHTSGIGEP